jgi:nitroreductase
VEAAGSEQLLEQSALSRKGFLKLTGAGTAFVAIAGSGLGTWRAVDQGVFSVGQGPAYAAWNVWSGTPGDGPLNLVRAAVLAANAHDSQPWIFRVTPTRIDIHAALTRNLGSIDPLRREMYISLGCALENLLVAAAPHGYDYRVSLLPNPTEPAHVARVELRPGMTSTTPLYDAIPHRHTNRAAYQSDRPVTALVRSQMEALNTIPEIGIVWFTGAAEKRVFADLTVRATQAFIVDRQQARDDFAWWRGDWHDVQKYKDGITLDASNFLPPLTRSLAKLLPPQTRLANDTAWLSSTRNPQLSSAPAFGIIMVRRAESNRQRLEAGQLWQRMHLWATARGIAMQPLNQIVERAEREQTAGLRTEIGSALSAMMPEHGWHALMPFRLGYPTTEALKSPRRPAENVSVRV